MRKKDTDGRSLRPVFLSTLLLAFGLLAVWTAVALGTFEQDPHSPAPFAFIASPMAGLAADVEAEAEAAAAGTPPPALTLTVAMQTATITAPKEKSAMKVSLLATVRATLVDDLCQAKMVHLTATVWVTTALATIACPPSQTMAASSPAAPPSPTSPLSAIVSPLSVIVLPPLTLPTVPALTAEPPVLPALPEESASTGGNRGFVLPLEATEPPQGATLHTLFAARGNGLTAFISLVKYDDGEPMAIFWQDGSFAMRGALTGYFSVGYLPMLAHYNMVSGSITMRNDGFWVDNGGISVRIPTAQGTLAMRYFPAAHPLHLGEESGYSVAHRRAGHTVNFIHRLFGGNLRYTVVGEYSSQRVVTSTVFMHYFGAEHAAYALHYTGASLFSEQVHSVYHGGALTPASYFTQSLAPAIYTIPYGASFGQVKYGPWLGMAYNHRDGRLDVDFARSMAVLSMWVAVPTSDTHSRNPAFPIHYYWLRDFQLSLSADKRTFSNLHCPIAGGSATTSCKGEVIIGHYPDAEAVPGSEGSEGGELSKYKVTMLNSVARQHSTLRVHGAFYGDKAQEFALGVEHPHLSRLTGEPSDGFFIGVLGRRVATPQTVFAARANGLTTTVHSYASVRHRGSVYVTTSVKSTSTVYFTRFANRELGRIYVPHGEEIVRMNGNGVIGHATVVIMMKHFNRLHFSVTGKAGAELTVGDAGISVRVPGAQGTVWTLMYETPQPMHLDDAGYTVAQNQASVTVNYVHRLYTNSVSFVSANVWHPGSVFTHHLGGEHAAFAVNYGRTDAGFPRGLQASAFHGGDLAPASYFGQSLAPVTYVIPVGAALGYMKRGEHYGLIYNHEAGLLAVNFAGQLAQLNLLLSAAANAGTDSSLLFSYELRDFQMSLSADKRTFGNLHCRSAGGTVIAGCGGDAFAPALSATVKNRAAARGSLLKVHGGFYGGKAQEFALGLEHSLDNGDSGVFLGALGRKGISPQTLYAAHAATTSSIRFTRHSRDNLVAILLPNNTITLRGKALSGHASVDVMMAHFNSVHFSITGKSSAEVAVGDAGISVRVPGAQGTLWTLMYEAPQPLYLNEAGYTVAQNQASATVGYVHRLFSNAAVYGYREFLSYVPCGKNLCPLYAYASYSGTVFTHHLGGEHAAFAVHYGKTHVASPSGLQASVFHGGVLAPASYFGQSLAPVTYVIPVGAAVGYMKRGDDYGLIYNHEAGRLAVNFAGQLAQLNLLLSAAANAGTDSSLLFSYELRDFQMSLSADKRTFGNLHCRSAGGTMTAGCGGDAFAPALSATVKNRAASRGSALKVHGGFYGGKAQEFALGLEYLLNNGDSGVFLGALGRKGISPQTVFAAHATATSSIRFTRHSRSELVAILLPNSTIALRGKALSGHVTTDVMMAHFNSVHFSITGKSSAEVAVGDAGISVRVPGAQGTLWTLMYQAPQPLYLNEAGGYAVVQNQAGATVNYVHRLFSNATAYSYREVLSYVPCGNRVCPLYAYASYSGTVFTHYLGGEHAAFAVHYGRTGLGRYPHDLQATAYHSGNLAPASHFTQSLAPAVYAIPARAAVGHMKRDGNYGLIYNHKAGELAVDFASKLARLHLTMSMAANSSTLSPLLFSYGLRDFQLSLSADKRTFSNFHCPVAGGSATENCGGEAFSDALQVTVANNAAIAGHSNNKLNVHGGFYGSKAQEFALGLEMEIRGRREWRDAAGVLLGALGRKMVVQTLFAAHATATSSIRFTRSSDGELLAIRLPNNTIALQGKALSGRVSVDVMMAHFNSVHFSITGKSSAEVAVGDAGISVRVPGAQGTLWTLMYEAPQPLYLNEAGYTVAQNQASVTVNYVHRLFSNATSYVYAERGSYFRCGIYYCISYNYVGYAGTVFTHHLGGEHAAFAVHYGRTTLGRYPHDLQATAYHSGNLAPASYFAQSLPPAVYAIPARAAVGYMKRDGNYGLIYNHEAGELAVDFASKLARLHLTMSMAANSSTLSPLLFSYGLRDFELSLSADKRTFSNFHCPVAGGSATENCGGEAFSDALQVTVANSAAIVGHSNNKLNVHGGFYGGKAQEFALGLEMEIRGRREWRDAAGVLLGALGRKQQAGGGSGGAGGASGSSAPAGVVAAFADGVTVRVTADYKAFVRAEYAAFAVLTISGVQQMAHLGTRTPAPFFPSLTHQAVYRIDAGRAGGWHIGAGGARLSLGNTGSADQLRVDFAADTAALDLSFEDASGVHGYVLQGVALSLQADGNGFQLCGVCTGTVIGSGTLSGFDSVQGLQVDGAFYGDRAQEAAGVLRHRIDSSGESLDLGFVGAAAADKR